MIPDQTPVLGEARMPTVLIVEDEPLLLQRFRYALELEGYTVLAAVSADSAIRVSGQCTGAIDVLVSDVALSPLDGAQLGRMLKQQRPTMSVVLMSRSPAERLPDLRVADAFVQKPFPHSALIQAVARCLPSTVAKRKLVEPVPLG
jgi:DNA-binding NtrC family response regulator